MSRPDTTMKSTALTQFAGAAAGYYAPLFGTPAGEIAREIAVRFSEGSRIRLNPGEDCPDGMHIVPPELLEEGDNAEYAETDRDVGINEEVFERNGLDEFANRSLDTLKKGIDEGLYPEGSITRTMVDYLIHNLEAFQRRELVFSAETSMEGSELPGVDIASKAANYVFIPKMSATQKVIKNGQEVDEYIYPEGFAKDDTMHFMKPRNDQRIAKYSMQELQESADKVNFGGFTAAAAAYENTIRDVNHLITMQDPSTPEQERILKDSLLQGIRSAKNEMNKAMAADPEDEVAVRMFGSAGQMSDSLTSEGRGFVRNIAELTEYENYLGSGMPLAGFSEWNDLKNQVNLIYEASKEEYKDYITNDAQPFKQACKELHDAVNTLPENPEKYGEWQTRVKNAMEGYNEEYRKLSESLQFVKKEFRKLPKGLKGEEERVEFEKLKDEIEQYNETRKNIKKSFTGDGIFGIRAQAFREKYAPMVDSLGQSAIKEKREHVNSIVSDTAARQRGLAGELKKMRSVFMPGELKNAIDEAVHNGDSRAYSPKEFHESLKKVEEAADRAGNTEVRDWCRKKGAYFGNRMKELESKGMSSDLTLDYQLSASREGRKDYLDSSLRMFNTRRSRVFGKGENKDLGKESPEHKALREATEKFSENKKKLEAMEDKNSLAYKRAANELIRESREVQKLSFDYLRDKNLSAITGAGGQRLNGALLIRREAKLIEAELTKQVEKIDRYTKIEQKTQVARLEEMQKQGDYAGIVNSMVDTEIKGMDNPDPSIRQFAASGATTDYFDKLLSADANGRLIHEEELKQFIGALAEAQYNEQKLNGVVIGQESPRLAGINSVGFFLTGDMSNEDKTVSSGQSVESFIFSERTRVMENLRQRDELAKNNAAAENAGPKNDPPKDNKIKEIKIDTLMKKFNQEKPEKEAHDVHGRRSVHVRSPKDNSMQNPRTSF